MVKNTRHDDDGCALGHGSLLSLRPAQVIVAVEHAGGPWRVGGWGGGTNGLHQYYRTIIVLCCQVYLELAGFNLHNAMLYNLNDVFRSPVVRLCPGAFSLSDGPRFRIGTPVGIGAPKVACERLRRPA